MPLSETLSRVTITIGHSGEMDPCLQEYIPVHASAQGFARGSLREFPASHRWQEMKLLASVNLPFPVTESRRRSINPSVHTGAFMMGLSVSYYVDLVCLSIGMSESAMRHLHDI